jgi:hypothetical protein
MHLEDSCTPSFAWPDSDGGERQSGQQPMLTFYIGIDFVRVYFSYAVQNGEKTNVPSVPVINPALARHPSDVFLRDPSPTYF